jgi:hypothetical protein
MIGLIAGDSVTANVRLYPGAPHRVLQVQVSGGYWHRKRMMASVGYHALAAHDYCGVTLDGQPCWFDAADVQTVHYPFERSVSAGPATL